VKRLGEVQNSILRSPKQCSENYTWRQKARLILRTYPTLYNLMANVYTKCSACYSGFAYRTAVLEKEWSARDASSAEAYWANRNLPSKDFLLQNITTPSPANMLEIGCNCGPNLYKLSLKYPDATIVGTDINKMAIQKGNEWFREEGISNVKLFALRAEEHNQFPDKSFDVVFSWAVLLLIGPDKIGKVLKEMFRLAKKELILIEKHEEDEKKDPRGLGYVDHGYWKRDYVCLLKHIIPDFVYGRIDVIKIPEEVWHPAGRGRISD